MNYILLLGSVLSTTIQNSTQNWFGKKQLQNTTDFIKFQTISFGFTLVILMLSGTGFEKPSAFTVVFGVIFGLMLGSTYLMLLFSYATGPMAYTTVIVSCAMLIPTMAGVIFWKEKLNVGQIIGIALILVSLCLGMEKEAQGEEKASGKWLFYCMTAFMCSGIVGVLQKVHQTSAYKDEIDSFLIVAFISAVLFFFTVTTWRSRTEQASFSYFSKAALFGGIMGICMAFCNKVNLYLSGALPGSVFFPLLSGGGIVCSALAASVVFKEKSSRKQNIGIAVGILAIILVGRS